MARTGTGKAAWLSVCGWLVLSGLAWSAEGPWPAPVPGWKAPAPGEHPRLFFRKADLPEIRQRAATPEGQVIVRRLRSLLDGKEGTELPGIIPAPGVGTPDAPAGKALTLWHPAGYGMLYHLTGDRTYAALGQRAMERILRDAGDIDPRYGFVKPNGALRAGPSLGAVAMGYDLCYDGWDEDFRQKVAKAIQAGPGGFALDYLVNGMRHSPRSNHWGCQVGGGALAVLALWNDPGVDNGRIKTLLEDSSKAMIRQLTDGFGDGGMYWEGKGPGGIASDTAFIPAIQAWRVAGGRDFVTPRPNAAAIALVKVQELMMLDGEPWYLIAHPSSYGSGYFGPAAKGGLPSDRDGLSRAGQFAQGFGAVPDKVKPAMLWVYDHIVERDAATRTYDTVSKYPHRAVLALVNWPIGLKEVNPAEILPKVHWDSRLGLYVFRNQWTGTEDDIVVDATFAARDPHPFMIWGKGQKLNVGTCPKGETTHFQPAEDGSGTVSAGGAFMGVDFSRASGADALVVLAGKGAAGGLAVTAGAMTYNVILVGGKAEPKVVGNKVIVGGQGFTCDSKKIIFDKMAGPPRLPRMGCW